MSLRAGTHTRGLSRWAQWRAVRAPIYKRHCPRWSSTSASSSPNHILPTAQDAQHTPDLLNPPPSFSSDPAPFSHDAFEVAQQQVHDLHALGLGTTWGPTSMLQNVIDQIHVLTGLPWWGTIVASTVLVRLCVLPVSIKIAKTMSKMALFSPKIQDQMSKMRNAQIEGNQIESVRAQTEVTKLYAKAGVRRTDTLWGLVQIPVYFCFYRALMGMSSLPVPGFTHGGTLWFPDLTAADPYVGLGLYAGTVTWLTFRMGSEAGAGNAMSPSMQKVMMVAPFLMVPLCRYFPAAVYVYFATNSTFGFFQGLLLRNPACRKLLGIPPMPTPEQLREAGKKEGPEGFKGNFQAIMKSFRDKQELAVKRKQEEKRGKDYAKAVTERTKLNTVKLEDMDSESRARKERQRHRLQKRKQTRSRL